MKTNPELITTDEVLAILGINEATAAWIRRRISPVPGPQKLYRRAEVLESVLDLLDRELQNPAGRPAESFPVFIVRHPDGRQLTLTTERAQADGWLRGFNERADHFGTAKATIEERRAVLMPAV